MRVWKGGSWSPIPAPFSRESRISHVFHQLPESRFSFPQKYITKSNSVQKLINVRCRLILSIDILNLRVFLKASAKRNSFLYLSMKKEHDRKAWSVVLYACALSLIGSLQEQPRPRLLGELHCLLRCWSQNHTLTAGHQYHQLNWVLRWLGRQQVALSYTCLEEESLLHVWCCSDEPRAVRGLCHFSLWIGEVLALELSSGAAR